MRIIHLSIGIVLSAGIGYLSYEFLAELDSRIQQRKQVENARSKAVASLLRTTAFQFEQVVIEPGRTEGKVSFRSRVAPMPEAVVAQSAYGVIRKDCPQDAPNGDEPDCLKLVELYIDGNAVDPLLDVQPKEPILETPVLDKTPSYDIVESAVMENDFETVVISREPTVVSTEEPTPPPTTSHIVQRTLVNARSGPSTRSRVLAQLPVGTRLSLIEAQGSWGSFLVLNGASTDLKAWIAFNVLNPA